MIGGVVGYTYQAEMLCPSCTIKTMRASGIKVQRGKPHEDAIRRAAQNLNIDFDDEHSYDSDRFPKTVTQQMCETELTELPDGEHGVISDERCTGDKCGKWLVLKERSPTEARLTAWARDTYELPQALARGVSATLREWGLSHPEFISEDNVRQAAAQYPHDWVSYRFKDTAGTQTVAIHTPDYDGATCMHCDKPWEMHLLTCDTCAIDVPADVPHSHQVQVKGQIKFREVTKAA